MIRVTELVSLKGTNLGLHRDYWSGVGCRAPPPPPPPTSFFYPGHISSPSIQNRIFFCPPVSLSTLVIGSSLKIFDETAPFWRNFDFFCVFGLFGVPGTCVFFGDVKTGQNPENWIWGPVEAVSANFSGNLKVVHGDSATDEAKNSIF